MYCQLLTHYQSGEDRACTFPYFLTWNLKSKLTEIVAPLRCWVPRLHTSNSSLFFYFGILFKNNSLKYLVVYFKSCIYLHVCVGMFAWKCSAYRDQKRAWGSPWSWWYMLLWGNQCVWWEVISSLLEERHTLLSPEPPPPINLLKMILLLGFKKWLLFFFTEKFALFLKTVVYVKLKMSQGKWMDSNN